MARIAADKLARVFVDVADTLVDEFDTIEFLQMVTAHTSSLVEARAAGLLLADTDGHLRVMAASDERAGMIELFQVQAVEGPCQDCYRTGEPVIEPDLNEATGRWPRFSPRALQAGYRSVHAFPMRLRQRVIGALNLFGDEAGPLSTAEVSLVQALADVATIGLLQQETIRKGELLGKQLQSALESRIVVEQAKGALAHIHGGTPDEAFVLLRAYCRAKGLRLGDVARAVATNPDSVPDLTRR